MKKLFLSTMSFFLLLGLAIPSFVRAQTLSTGEKQKIEALIQYVGKMSEANFVRNGSSYDAKTAATFLRLKWGANATVKTAHDFIDKIGTMSGTSGKPYLIRFKDGSEMKSRDVLLAALNKIETPTSEQASVGGNSSFSNQ